MKKLMMTVAALGGVTLFAGNALAASDYDCRVYAEQQANAYAPNGAGAVTGGLLGALGGAAIAGISGGNTGTGAIAGGVGGAVIGGVGNQQNRQQIYNNAYWQCRGKGNYAPAQPVYNPGAPPPGYGQQWWMQACSQKYNSFQWTGPHAGQFKGYDGYWHWCSL